MRWSVMALAYVISYLVLAPLLGIDLVGVGELLEVMGERRCGESEYH